MGGLACGAAAAALSRTALGEQAAAWNMRLSTSSIHFSSLSIEDACARIAGLGFEAIDIWCPFGKCDHLTQVADRLGAEGLKKVLAANKLKLNAFSVYRGSCPWSVILLIAVGYCASLRRRCPVSIIAEDHLIAYDGRSRFDDFDEIEAGQRCTSRNGRA